MKLAPVGNYALNILFSDNHKVGMFSWSYLHYIGTNKFSLMKEYIKELREKKRSRQKRITNLDINLKPEGGSHGK